MKDNRLNPGDIFTIPLYLPFLQEWRTCIEDFIDYKKYEFSQDDIYAFGRFIGTEMGNVPLIEVFQYAGKIPKAPEIILQSGRMFEPVYVVSVFKRSRWRFLYGMMGNGYDWQKIASAFMEKYMPELEKKCEFDCEADTFSMISSSKKLLKDFAVKFHQFCTDTAAFGELLSALK